MANHWRTEVRHNGLGKYRVITGPTREIVDAKAFAQRQQWDKMWERQQAAEEKRIVTEKARAVREQDKAYKENQKDAARKRTLEAKEIIDSLDSLLQHTLTVNDAIDWNALFDRSSFSEIKPIFPSKPEIPKEPITSDEKYNPKIGLLDTIFLRTNKRIEESNRQFSIDHENWSRLKSEAERLFQEHLSKHRISLESWEKRKSAYTANQKKRNDELMRQKNLYEQGDKDGIEQYFDLVLSRSQYGEWYTYDSDLEYQNETKTLIVDIRLPSIGDIPTLIDVRYNVSKDEMEEKHLSQSQLREIYDNVIFQICLRTIHEIFESDISNHIDAIAFNGTVEFVDKSKGKLTTACIATVIVKKKEFSDIDLSAVDPRACFRSLKGVSASRLADMAPVAPLLDMNRNDARFVAHKNVVASLNEGQNLATIDWEDFEHFIREVFEAEFAQSGGEVKITQASRDGGVDAVAFDPDPLRGGKIVIQAKRYTNTVGVSAVRDLYGTVVNEGATKGILVTTSQFGPDALKFAQDKPLSLIDGSNLLFLLERQGIKARIDIDEARKLRADSDSRK